MLLELAIGDAYGAGFEYADEMVDVHNDLTNYIKHPRHRGLWPGRYTDDTQMSIAVAELIVSGQDWTPLNIAQHFVTAFKRDRREGYATNFHAFLVDTRDGQHFLDRIRPDSDKSGAAMRAVPIGMYTTEEEVLKKCATQAAVTHNTADGIAAANAAALTAHFFIYNRGDKADLPAYLRQHIPSAIWEYTMPDKVKAQGWMSVRAAITALMRNDRLSTLLQDCVAFKGDVDTVATIALGAASTSKQYQSDLPAVLIDGLENGAYGRDYLIQLDQQLSVRFSK